MGKKLNLSAADLEGAVPVSTGGKKITLSPEELEGAAPIEGFEFVPQQRGPGPYRDQYVGGDFSRPAPPAPPAPEPDNEVEGFSLGQPFAGMVRSARTPEGRKTMAVQGLAALAGGAGGAAAAAGLGAVAPAAGLGTRLAIGALSGAAGGAAQGGTEAALTGQPVVEGIKQGGATGALMGGGMAAAGEAAGGLSKLLRRDRWLGQFGGATDAGKYKASEYTSEDPKVRLPEGPEGTEEAAHRGLKRILGRDRQLAEEASRDYQAETIGRDTGAEYTPPGGPAPAEAPLPTSRQLPPSSTEVVGPGQASADYTPPKPPQAPPPKPQPQGAKGPVDRDALLADLRAQRAENINPDNGLPHDPALDAKFEEAINKVLAGDRVSIRGALGERRALKNKSGFGSPNPTEGQEANRGIYGALRRSIRKASPDIAAADDKFAARARLGERRRDILFNTEDNVVTQGNAHGEGNARPTEFSDEPIATAEGELAGEPQLRVGREKAAVATLKRVGDTNEPGVRAKRYIEELSAQDPEFAAAVDDIANKKAYEMTRVGLPQKPTSLSGAMMWPLRLGEQNLRALGGRAIDPALQVGRSVLGTPQLQVPLLRALARSARRRDEGQP